MLIWLDGRNSSSFSSLTWNTNTLSFTITAGSGANGLQAMLPTSANSGTLNSLRLNGGPVTYTVQTIKGTPYALFPAIAGSYQAVYGASSAPVVSSVAATSITSSGAVITWTTDKSSNSQVNYGTTSTYGSSSALNSTLVTSHSVTLSGLAASTLYHYQARSADSLGALGTSGDLIFTTLAAGTSACPCTIWSSPITPAIVSDADTSAVELGVKFTSDVNGYITGIRFYKGSLNTGTHTGSLWSSSGTLLATATFSGETASGWQQVNFSTAVAITANTTYVASYYTTVGHYSNDRQYFATSSFDNPPLHALASGASGNGVYVYGTGGVFPNSSYNQTNYWVDVVFKTTLP